MEKCVNLNMIWTNSLGLKYIQNTKKVDFKMDYEMLLLVHPSMFLPKCNYSKCPTGWVI
jgi:hypothetical protein